MTVPILPVTFQAPGFKGLNSQLSSTALDSGWATELENTVFDQTGKITSRKGWEALTTSGSPGAHNIEQIHCYETESATTVICASNAKIYSGTTTLTDRTGTITAPTGNNWCFQNFNATKIVAWQLNHPPIVSTSGGNFADIVVSDGGTIPDGNVCLAAFGRIFATKDDGYTVQYSALLDETKWAVASGAGSFSTLNYWPKGKDYVTAMAVYEDKLVVFGQRNILVYDSPEAPGSLVLNDIIEGVGCIARDSVQSVGTDILFLSETGIRSLRKSLITTKSPMQDISINIRDELVVYATAGNASKIRSCYNPVEGFYLLLIPSSTSPTIWCFDVKNLQQQYTDLPQAEQIRVSKWTGLGSCTAIAYGRDLTMYLGVRDGSSDGIISEYSGYIDGTENYTMKYKSPWMDLGNEQEGGSWYKIPKQATVTTVGGGAYQPTFAWAFDFERSEYTKTASVISSVTPAEYGVAEYGIGEYNASSRELANSKMQLSHYGHFMRIGVSVPITGKEISIQKIDLYMKRGRISR